jgi:hypothetical protein
VSHIKNIHTHTSPSFPALDEATTPHPLGPLVERIAPLHRTHARLKAAMVLTGSLALLLVAGWLKPDPSGMGSHQQLGLPACNMVIVTGYPCPTCGMTTAFAYTVRGLWFSAFRAQPAGFALALMTAGAAIASIVVLWTGRVWVMNWYRISPALVTLLALAGILLGWIFKLVVGIAGGTLPVHHGLTGGWIG